MPVPSDDVSALAQRLRADGLFHDAEVVEHPDRQHLLVVLVPQGYRPAPAVREHVLGLADLPDGQVSIALVPRIPRHADGSLDLAATLARVGDGSAVSRYVAPETDAERMLVDLVSAVSPGLRISVTDSLGDLGLDSLMVFELAALLSERTGTMPSLESLYAAESLRALAGDLAAGG
jgi:acyl carrier protein